jgi:chromosome partitioning protein
MRCIAFVNEKGGTCKTTLAVNLAAWLAKQGRRVLLVDLDTQGHAGKSLGVDVRPLTRTVLDLLLDPALAVDEVLVETSVKRLSLLPSNKALADYPVRVASDPDRAARLGRVLEGLDGRFDDVVVDTPPSAGLLPTTALMAATHVVIPVATSYLALDGCAEVAATVSEVRTARGGDHPLLALVVPTLYRKTKLAGEVVAKLRQHFGEAASRTVLATSVHLDEAQSHGETIFEYAPRSKGALMMSALGRELSARLDASLASVAA